MKEHVEFDGIMVEAEIANFAEAYLQYGHNIELLMEMFGKSRSTIHKWLKRRDFLAVYLRKTEKAYYTAQNMCKVEAPKTLAYKIAHRDKLKTRIDNNTATVQEQRLFNDINTQILEMIMPKNLNIDAKFTGDENAPIVIKVKGPGDT